MRTHRNTWPAIGLIFSLITVMAACAKTDAGITTAVKTGLAADDTVKAFQIDVDTKNTVVTLSGTVDSAAAKARAVTVAQGTSGVTNVVDNITVKALETSGRPAEVIITDAALTAAVKTKLLAEPKVSGLKIDVDSKDGVVTLNGAVKSQAEKDEALRLARTTDSVRSVVDHLTIAP